MKEVRLNDKFWYGKYMGLRIKDIIQKDPNFITELIKNQIICLDPITQKFLNSKYNNNLFYLHFDPPRRTEELLEPNN